MFLTNNNHITVKWMNTLLVNVIKKLPKEYNIYTEQINNKIIEKVYKPGFASTFQQNYIGFGYNKDIVNKYDTLSKIDPMFIDKHNLSKGFILCGIEIFNTKEKKYIEIELYFGDGLIVGINSTIKLDMKSFDYENIVVRKLIKKES